MNPAKSTVLKDRGESVPNNPTLHVEQRIIEALLNNSAFMNHYVMTSTVQLLKSSMIASVFCTDVRKTFFLTLIPFWIKEFQTCVNNEENDVLPLKSSESL